MTAAWVAVACRAHVRRGVELGIMQVCHGKAGPLRRIKCGDRVAYYSPTETMAGGEKVQGFTALGHALDDEVYQVDMGGGFRPFRRRVRYLAAELVPIRFLLDRPGFALAGRGWGAKFRTGLVSIDGASMDMIAQAMRVI
ncbi:MAG: EVE domain-containing protein [Alphaproteobacteria bacterium]|nr:EVE domain-containing protein [Alphaproteobacteria bacterium]